MPVANYNYDTEQADLQRRQKIADAMMAGSLQPLQMPQGGRIVSRMNPLQAMLPALQAFMARRESDGIKAEQGKLGERYQADLRTGMDAFGETAKTDKRKAIQDAMASNHPVLKEYGLSELKKLTDGQLTPKDLATHARPGDVLKNPNDPTQWQTKEELGEAEGVVYDKNSKQIVKLGQPGGQPPEQVVIGGDRYERNPSTGKLRKLDNAPKVTVGVHPTVVNAGQKEGMKTYWENGAKQVDALGKIAGQASNNKQSIQELMRLDANGIYSNVSTGGATFLANLGEAAGIPVDVSKLGNTESFNAITTDLWQGLVSKYGGNRGVTKEEAVEIKKMLPLAASSPQARQQIYAILNRASDRQIKQYEQANQSFAAAVQKDDPSAFSIDFQSMYNPEPNQPQAVTPSAARPNRPAAKPSVSNW